MADPFRIVYMGTPEFALPPLRALHQSGERMAAAVTQPDKAKGRGMKRSPPPVALLAREMGIPVIQPRRVSEEAFLSEMRALEPDLFVVAAYGKILPPALLAIPRLLALNIHGSILPKYRGAAPIPWAILCGEEKTGVTIMRMEEGLDTGDMALQEEVPIKPDDTSVELGARLSEVGARLIVEAVARLHRRDLRFTPQDDSRATMAPMLRKEDGEIRWSSPSREIRDRIRAFCPWPGAYTRLGGKLLKIWRARILPATAGIPPGTVSGSPRGTLWVQAGDGIVILDEVQLEGRMRLPAATFLRGRPMAPGTRLG